jgi:hypothetical protein
MSNDKHSHKEQQIFYGHVKNFFFYDDDYIWHPKWKSFGFAAQV